jgi:hypothetical protein
MRLTVNLESDIYALARSLAREEDCSISAAVNRLLRRSLSRQMEHRSRTERRPSKRSGFAVSRGRKPITADTVRQAESEDDES